VLRTICHKGKSVTYPDAAFKGAGDHGLNHSARPGQAPGLEGVKQLFASLHAAFSDFHIDVEDMIAEGDKVVARVRGSGTHQGEFMGIAPTGNRVEFSAIDISRIAEG